MSGSHPPASGLADIELILRSAIGLDASTVGITLVERAVQRRMAKRAITSLAAYAGELLSDANELQELVEEVVVPETYFFREPEALAAVARRALDSLTSLNGEAPLRVLSVPSSSGEEPYSIAMALLMAGLPPEAIAIDAIDVSLDAVKRANAGVFRGGSFRGETAAWKDYFRESSRGWELADSVRALVRVRHGNLVAASFQPLRDQYDVIFCRNLLIYFDADAQSRALANLAPLLAPDGVLVVGSADSFAVRRAGFEPLPGFERSFLFRRQQRARTSESTVEIPARARSIARTVPIRPARRITVAAKAAASIARPVSPVRFPAADRNKGGASIVLAEIGRLANEGRFAEALVVGNCAMREGLASAEFFALMGTTHAAALDLARAEECYRRALFLEPTHEEALLHLSLLLDQRGERKLADRLRTRARRALVSNAVGMT